MKSVAEKHLCEQPSVLSSGIVMLALPVLTAVLALVLCLVMGFLVARSHLTKTAADPRGGQTRPWVDQDLKDDSEVESKEHGKIHTLFEF